MRILYRLRKFIQGLARRATNRSRTQFSSSPPPPPRTHMHMHMHITHLPPELLLHIFALLTADPALHPRRLAPALTHVCTRWRHIALAAPGLWARIALTHPWWSPTQLAYAVVALQRSASHPIDILLDLRDPEWEWAWDGEAYGDGDNDDTRAQTHTIGWKEMETIVRLLLPHVHRWRRVELLTDTWAPIFTFLWYTRSTPAPSAPPLLLESLSLLRCNAYLAARGQVFQPASLSAPLALFGGIQLISLRQLALVGVHVDWENLPALPSLRALTLKFHVRGVMPTLSQFQRIVSGSPHLARLAVYGWGPVLPSPESDSDELTSSILALSVRRLELGVLDAEYTARFVGMLDVPLLRDLVLEDITRAVSPTDAPDTNALMRWLAGIPAPTTTVSDGEHQYSSTPHPTRFPLAQIHSLELHGISSNMHAFVALFRRLDALTRLGVYNPPDETVGSALVALTDPVSDPAPALVSGEFECNPQQAHDQAPCVRALPNLRELHFRDAPPETVLRVAARRGRFSSGGDGGSTRISLSLSASGESLAGEWGLMQMRERLGDAGVDVDVDGESEDGDDDESMSITGS